MSQMLVKLTDIGTEDNPKTFLVTFEHVFIVVKWPPDHWAMLLVLIPDRASPKIPWMLETTI